MTHTDTHRAPHMHTPLYNQVIRSQGSRALEAGKVPGASHSYSRLCASRQHPYELGGKHGPGCWPALCMSDLAPMCARDPGFDSVLGVACLFPLRVPSLHHMSMPQCVSMLPPHVCFVSSWTRSPSPVFSKTPSLTPRLCPRPHQTGTTNPGALRSSLSSALTGPR